MPLKNKLKQKTMCGKIKLVLAIFFGILLASCNQNNSEKTTQGVIINTLEENEAKNDDSFKLTADLPIKLDSSDYIIYPVHELVNSKYNSKISYKWRSGYENNLNNIIFQNIHTDKTHSLTNDKIKIISYEQLYNTKREAEKIIIYQIIDKFPKNDDELIYTSLYLGTSDGKLFKKISKLNHHLKGWKYISETKRVYFKTIEDSDRNNEFNNLDNEHLYSVSIEDFIVSELLTDGLKTIAK
jgi:hypothetical protein